jgi:tripartite-type tricarboxylate transporter receptor subunit TctC
VKTGIEQGLAPVDARVQFLLFAPAGTPKPIVSTLSDHLIKVVQDPSLVDAFAKLGFEPTPFGTEEATRRMKETAEAWAPVIRRLNIKLN